MSKEEKPLWEPDWDEVPAPTKLSPEALVKRAKHYIEAREIVDENPAYKYLRDPESNDYVLLKVLDRWEDLDPLELAKSLVAAVENAHQAHTCCPTPETEHVQAGA